MIHGLIWLPLLGLFIGLTWAGWNEYQKLEAYKVWAAAFDHAKYDIYAVLGQKGAELTWGKPTRKGAQNLQSFSLRQVQSIELLAGDRPIDLTHPPATARKVAIAFQFADASPIQIPFTDLSIALKWTEHLQQDWQQFREDSAIAS
ncbi:hypothetical protein IFO70_17705 [Phormidium tenue FACHB-886]|nr:hypothetical protein [Phormidium tenue FACHB-886]